MLKLQPTFSFKKLGVHVLTAGAVLFFSPLNTEANELGDKDLTAGDNNAQVEDLQELLNERGLLKEDEVTGEFDETTVQAIQSFQEEHNLNIDGIAGPHTIGALDVLGEGDEGKPVKTLQEKLNKLGFYDNTADGKFGPKTDQAVRNFQQSADILVDGLAGPQTFGALINTEVKPERTSSEDEDSNSNSEPKASQPKTSTKSQVSSKQTTEKKSSQADGRTLQVNATAYTADCAGCSGITATGVNLNNNRNAKVIAVDPNVIPLGSKVHIEGYGTYTAADTGGAIEGNRIDIHMPSRGQALDFGRRSLEVTILN